MNATLDLTVNYSASAETDDYPSGRHRVQAKWYTEHKSGKGVRLCRETVNPRTGQWAKPKKGTYEMGTRIVFGRLSDGRVAVVRILTEQLGDRNAKPPFGISRISVGDGAGNLIEDARHGIWDRNRTPEDAARINELAAWADCGNLRAWYVCERADCRRCNGDGYTTHTITTHDLMSGVKVKPDDFYASRCDYCDGAGDETIQQVEEQGQAKCNAEWEAEQAGTAAS